MDVRHPLYQAIASVLAGILILNPIVAAAAELAVDAAAGPLNQGVQVHAVVLGDGVGVGVGVGVAVVSHVKYRFCEKGQMLSGIGAGKVTCAMIWSASLRLSTMICTASMSMGHLFRGIGWGRSRTKPARF